MNEYLGTSISALQSSLHEQIVALIRKKSHIGLGQVRSVAIKPHLKKKNIIDAKRDSHNNGHQVSSVPRICIRVQDSCSISCACFTHTSETINQESLINFRRRKNLRGLC